MGTLDLAELGNVCVLVESHNSPWGRRALHSGLCPRGVVLGKGQSFQRELSGSASKRRGEVAPRETMATKGKAI